MRHRILFGLKRRNTHGPSRFNCIGQGCRSQPMPELHRLDQIHVAPDNEAKIWHQLHVPRQADWQISLRSEEHTSELQSRENLVCRLLLEKKNNRNTTDSLGA